MNTKFLIFFFCIISLGIQTKKLRNQAQSLRTEALRRFWFIPHNNCEKFCQDIGGFVCPGQDGDKFAYQCATTQDECVNWLARKYTCNDSKCIPWLKSLKYYYRVDC